MHLVPEPPDLFLSGFSFEVDIRVICVTSTLPKHPSGFRVFAREVGVGNAHGLFLALFLADPNQVLKP